MKMTGNTVLITGGGSGIGRGLAEAFHQAGNQVIIAGRRRAALEEVTAANPGMGFVELDIEDPASIAALVEQVKDRWSGLNVLINNAGIMRDTVAGNGPVDEAALQNTIATNLVGPIRLIGALLEHLKGQAGATIVNVTSGLAFLPLTPVAVYCATKAALHSYTLSLRFDLRNSPVKVLELVPPYVATDLYNGANDPRAMPLAEFIDETMRLFATDADEIGVERVRMLRAPEDAAKEHAKVTGFNEMMAANPH